MTVEVDVTNATAIGCHDFEAGAGMCALRLRAESALLRDRSDEASQRKTRIAIAMVQATGPAYEALDIEQRVADCMMRRYRLWADQLEQAALELEEP